MFDIGFWELGLIGVVALLVVGPERLPGLARTAGLWFGRAQRLIQSVKGDIEQEMRADRLKGYLDKQNDLGHAYEIIEETKKAAADLSTAMNVDEPRADAPILTEDTPVTDPTNDPDGHDAGGKDNDGNDGKRAAG